jgi:organic hydroperoxide reductase OsmC/OhrA
MKSRDMKFPVCASWGRGGRLVGNGDVVDKGDISSGAGDKTKTGVHPGAVLDSGHSGCFIAGDLGGDGSRLPGWGTVGD